MDQRLSDIQTSLPISKWYGHYIRHFLMIRGRYQLLGAVWIGYVAQYAGPKIGGMILMSTTISFVKDLWSKKRNPVA